MTFEPPELRHRVLGWAKPAAWSVAGGLLLVTPALGQSIRGIVSEAVTEAPIAVGTVSAINRAGRAVESVLTDERGFFELQLPEDGLYVVRVTALGYRPGRSDPFEIDGGGSQIVYVNLTPAPVEIDGVVVSAESESGPDVRPSLMDRGFWSRLEEGRGQFLTPGDILASDAFFTSQLFDSMNNVLQDYTEPAWARGVRYILATDRGNCSPRVFIDDIRLSYLAGDGVYLSDVAPLEDVLAVEVFWGPFQAPIRYQGTMIDNSCGVVLIWTRGRTRM